MKQSPSEPQSLTTKSDEEIAPEAPRPVESVPPSVSRPKAFAQAYAKFLEQVPRLDLELEDCELNRDRAPGRAVNL